MPGVLHQGILSLFEDDPWLGPKHKLVVVVVIVSFSRRFSQVVRSWAHREFLKIEALLLDADSVAPMTLKQARLRPTAAVLVAALHGARGNVEAARIARKAIRHLPEDVRHRYILLMLAAMPVRQRARFLEEIPMKERDPLWEIEKRSGTYHVGRMAGRKEGRKEGRVEGRKEERVKGHRTLILTILKLRSIRVDRASAARIRSETNPSILRRWASAAQEVSRAAELFERN